MLFVSNVAAQSSVIVPPKNPFNEGSVVQIALGGTLTGPTVTLTITYTDGTATGGASCGDGIDYLNNIPTGTIRTAPLVINAGDLCDDTKDEPSEDYTITIAASRPIFDASQPNCSSSTACTAVVTIKDDDATVVTFDGIPASNFNPWNPWSIHEGQAAPITMTLSRTLVAEERVDVPVNYTDISTASSDYELRLKPGAANVGVTVPNSRTVRFDPGARIATLEFRAIHDYPNNNENSELMGFSFQNPSNDSDTKLIDFDTDGVTFTGRHSASIQITNNTNKPSISIRTKVLLEGPLQ